MQRMRFLLDIWIEHLKARANNALQVSVNIECLYKNVYTVFSSDDVIYSVTAFCSTLQFVFHYILIYKVIQNKSM